MNKSQIVAASLLASLADATAAHAGPCTAQIAKLEQLLGISASKGGGHGVPRNAGTRENAAAVSALRRAKQADADGNAIECNRDLDEVRRLFVIN